VSRVRILIGEHDVFCAFEVGFRYILTRFNRSGSTGSCHRLDLFVILHLGSIHVEVHDILRSVHDEIVGQSPGFSTPLDTRVDVEIKGLVHHISCEDIISFYAVIFPEVIQLWSHAGACTGCTTTCPAERLPCIP
jgi:hypothetical protein